VGSAWVDVLVGVDVDVDDVAPGGPFIMPPFGSSSATSSSTSDAVVETSSAGICAARGAATVAGDGGSDDCSKRSRSEAPSEDEDEAGLVGSVANSAGLDDDDNHLLLLRDENRAPLLVVGDLAPNLALRDAKATPGRTLDREIATMFIAANLIFAVDVFFLPRVIVLDYSVRVDVTAIVLYCVLFL